MSALPDSRALEQQAMRELEQADRHRPIDRGVLNGQRLVVGFRDDDQRRYGLISAEPGGFKLGRCTDCRHEVFGDLGAVEAVRRRGATVACMYCNDVVRYVDRANQWGIVSEL